jgi:hypothetical protein
MPTKDSHEKSAKGAKSTDTKHASAKTDDKREAARSRVAPTASRIAPPPSASH